MVIFRCPQKESVKNINSLAYSLHYSPIRANKRIVYLELFIAGRCFEIVWQWKR